MIRSTRWITPAVALALMLAACNKGETGAVKDTTAAGAPQTAQAHDSALTSQNAQLQAQKDSLFGATRSLLSAMASIDSATTAAGVKAKNKGEPITAYEEGVRARTVEALKRLRTTQARLRAINARVEALGGENSGLKSQVEQLTSTVSALQTQLTSSETRADSLVRQLYAANVRGDSLQYRTQQLGYTIDSTGYESRRVFVASGTASQLRKEGIVQEVGGTRFPFIVKIGQTVRPANTHPDTALFRAFDMSATTTIPIDTTRSYEIVSPQDLTGADRSDAKGRIFHGPIHITDPKVFWRPSPFLILVTQ